MLNGACENGLKEGRRRAVVDEVEDIFESAPADGQMDRAFLCALITLAGLVLREYLSRVCEQYPNQKERPGEQGGEVVGGGR